MWEYEQQEIKGKWEEERMIRWLKNCRILVMCLAAVLLLGTGIPVQAAAPESGTLKIRLKETGYRVEFAIYKVADYIDGNYMLTSEFAGSKDEVEDLNKLSNASKMQACAEQLIKWADDNHISPMYQEYTEDGVLDLGEVPLGMFLIKQIPHEDDKLIVASTLLGVPYWKVVVKDGKEYKVLEYFVESQPKGEEPVTPEPPPIIPDEPDKPDIKTGDDSGIEMIHYITMMAVTAGYFAYAVTKRKNRK